MAVRKQDGKPIAREVTSQSVRLGGDVTVRAVRPQLPAAPCLRHIETPVHFIQVTWGHGRVHYRIAGESSR
jgi:hypothetical protein